MIMKTQPVKKNHACVEAELSLFQALVGDFHPRDFDAPPLGGIDMARRGGFPCQVHPYSE